MELRQLVYFDAIVRHGGFTRAADQLHVAQPAISAQIRRLEAELGTPLLFRGTRRVALTHAGEVFWARVRKILEQLDDARTDLDDLSGVLRGHVRIGATEVHGSLDLSATMADFRRRHPGVNFSFRVGLVSTLLARMDAGEIDLVVGPAHPDAADRYATVPLVRETLVLVRPADSPELVPGKGTLAAMRDEPFVCLPLGSGLHTILTTAAEAEGFSPRIDFETYGPASVREMVAAGLGVALLAASVAAVPGPPVQVSQLQRAPWHPPICLIGPRQPAPTGATQAFRDHIVESARRLPDRVE